MMCARVYFEFCDKRTRDVDDEKEFGMRRSGFCVLSILCINIYYIRYKIF